MCSRSFGPAIWPSFVMWPTRTTAHPEVFASSITAWATDRTCPGVPGQPGLSGCLMAWTLSKTAKSKPDSIGRISCTPSRQTSEKPESPAFSRFALKATWDGDSSPETYRTRFPDAAIEAHACNSKVDLPTPGSPASKATLPAIHPPPSTRSSSSIPEGTRFGGGILERSETTGIPSLPVSALDPGSRSSCKVPQPPQVGHRPNQAWDKKPHSAQRNLFPTFLPMTILLFRSQNFFNLAN